MDGPESRSRLSAGASLAALCLIGCGCEAVEPAGPRHDDPLSYDAGPVLVPADGPARLERTFEFVPPADGRGGPRVVTVASRSCGCTDVEVLTPTAEEGEPVRVRLAYNVYAGDGERREEVGLTLTPPDSDADPDLGAANAAGDPFGPPEPDVTLTLSARAVARLAFLDGPRVERDITGPGAGDSFAVAVAVGTVGGSRPPAAPALTVEPSDAGVRVLGRELAAEINETDAAKATYRFLLSPPARAVAETAASATAGTYRLVAASGDESATAELRLSRTPAILARPSGVTILDPAEPQRRRVTLVADVPFRVLSAAVVAAGPGAVRPAGATVADVFVASAGPAAEQSVELNWRGAGGAAAADRDWVLRVRTDHPEQPVATVPVRVFPLGGDNSRTTRAGDE